MRLFPRLRLALATRIFVGYAVLLVTSGAVSIFSVFRLQQNLGEQQLLSATHTLLQHTETLLTTHAYRHKELTTDLADEQQPPATRRDLARLIRSYFSRETQAGIRASRELAGQLQTSRIPDSERPFVAAVSQDFADIEKIYAGYLETALEVFDLLEQMDADQATVRKKLDQLRGQGGAFATRVRKVKESLAKRNEDRMQSSRQTTFRTILAIVALSLLVTVVGLVATLMASKSLAPIRTLTDGVVRIGRGDYSAQLGVRGDDEISLLAREFDGMARSLREREGQLAEKQQALLLAEKLAAVGRMSAQVAHEIRNPLSSIGLNVEILEDLLGRCRFDTPEAKEEAGQLLHSVTREVDRLTAITEQYLKLARLPKPTLGPRDVNDVLARVLSLSREELQRAQVEVEQSLEPSLPMALADEGQLHQVFLNLVRNSREAMVGGGRLSVRSRAEKTAVAVEIADTGPGISPEVKARIFEPFFSTKSGGTGLGLAVTRQILQAHGGSIECQTREDGGARFVVRLQRA